MIPILIISKNNYKSIILSDYNSNNLYKGVYKRGNKFVASISKDGIKKEITGFETEEEAAKVYDMMAQELFGEFAGLNFPGNLVKNQ